MKTMSKLAVEDGSELKEIYESWEKSIKSDNKGDSGQNATENDSICRVPVFSMSKYEEIFSVIYSFYAVVEAIERAIEEELNKNEENQPQTVTVNGVVLQISTPAVNPKIKYRELTKQWNTLNDIHFSESEKEKLGLKFEDCLRLRYANYKGFIDRICMMIKENAIYY